MSQQTALARPPFAIDDKDTKYVEHTPQPRRPREERAKVSESTYDAYNNYLDTDTDSKHLAANNSSHRPAPSTDSSLGNGLFAALAAANDDSDDSDDDEHPSPARSPNPKSVPPLDISKSKNQALFEAAVGENDNMHPSPSSSIGPPPPAYEERGQQQRLGNEKGGNGRGPSPQPPRGPSPNLHPQQQYANRGPSPAPSITPPPPAAPLQVHIPAHQMNAPQPKRVITAGGPQPGGPHMGRGPPLSIAPPAPSQFNSQFGPPIPGSAAYGTPGFHMNPTPIPTHTSTPIQPAFIKPIKPVFIKPDMDGNEEKSPSVMSHESSMPIMRGDREDYLPLRSGPRLPRVGQKRVDGDDFWRRFSMVVKQEKVKPVEQKKSDWLKSNMRGGKSMTRWVWCLSIFVLILIGGGSAAGWYLTRGSPSHTIPVAIGGGAGETMLGTEQTVPTPVSGGTSTSAKSKAARTPEAKRAESAAVKMEKRFGTPHHHNAHKRHHVVGDFVVPDVERSAPDMADSAVNKRPSRFFGDS